MEALGVEDGPGVAGVVAIGVAVGVAAPQAAMTMAAATAARRASHPRSRLFFPFDSGIPTPSKSHQEPPL